MGVPLGRLANTMERLANDDRSVKVPFQHRRDEIGAMSRALLIFRNIAVARDEDLQVKKSLTELSLNVQKQKTLKDFADAALQTLAPQLGASVGVFFAFDERSERLKLFASYGYSAHENVPTGFALGEGLVGQCGLERKTLFVSSVPDSYLKVVSGTDEAKPELVLLVPVIVQDRLIGVLEFATFEAFDIIRHRIVDEAPSVVALPLENLRRILRTRELLEQSQSQTQELQAAEEELRAQQDELQATNDELERTNQYKSRFLANMSHELRTPLNSMLILAQDMAENAEGNLDAEQVEAATVIHASGVSLLRLINDILDLSKIEAGKLDTNREVMSLSTFCQMLERTFRPVAEQKDVRFELQRDASMPATIFTDIGKLEQIAINLIGNALKFTPRGSVRVAISGLAELDALSVVVTDTGIGIPADKLDTIFLPFEQVDASTRRQYGGTGLGLAISSQLATLLDGELTVESVEGQGASFRLIIPMGSGMVPLTSSGHAKTEEPVMPMLARADAGRQVLRDPIRIKPDKAHAVLVIEDDAGTQMAISQLLSRAGIDVTSAMTGEIALDLTERHEFDCLILDIGLPDVSGFEMLDLLSRNGKNLPVVIYSARDLLPEEVLRLREHTDSIILKGEHSHKRLLEEVEQFLQEPQRSVVVAPKPAPETMALKLLLVDDDMRNIYALAKVLRAKGIEVLLAQDGIKALAELDANPDVQIVLMDMMMPNMDGYEAMAEIRKRDGPWATLPIIALTAKAMKEDRDKCIAAGASDYLTKPVDVPRLLAMISEQVGNGR
nr:response regulator [Paracoccus aestuariivivens]